MADEMDRRYGRKGLHATSVHPGGIDTELSRRVGREMIEEFLTRPEVQRIVMSPQQGAATVVIAAVGKEWEGRGGKYLEGFEEAKVW